MNPLEHLPPRLQTRRQMLSHMGTGLGLLGLAPLLADDSRSASGDTHPLAPKTPHFKPRARRIIHIYLNGGPSQVDTFDPKPALLKYAGQRLPSGNLTTERPLGAALPLPSPSTDTDRADSRSARSSRGPRPMPMTSV